MGSLFRSEPMTLCQLFLHVEASYNCIAELGELGLAQFKDLNINVNTFHRKYVNEVRRCEEMERKIRFLEKEMKKDGVVIIDTGEQPEAPQSREMVEMELELEKLENEMTEVNSNFASLKTNFSGLTELKHVLRKAHNFLEENASEINFVQGMPDSLGVQQPTGNLGFVAGIIMRERMPAFERMLWRACRGNVLLKQSDLETALEDALTGDEIWKSVFIVFFQGDHLKSKVKKICDGFRATVYACPETRAERREMSSGVMTRIEDLNTVLSRTMDHRLRVLSGAASQVQMWSIKTRKIKAIYHTLNMFNIDLSVKCLIGECWCPVKKLAKIRTALQRGANKSNSTVVPILNCMDTDENPPTYNQTNKFTSVFQGIVDSYGVANYREVNPAPFTIITFPFLFSVMFGDAGHGALVFFAALWMVLFEKSLGKIKSDNEIWNIFFGGRYIILLMGLFSIYAGFLYNDVFSKSVNIFGSVWYPDNATFTMSTIHKSKDLMLNPIHGTDFLGYSYPFGMDPVWQMTLNKITFLNSFKMKISIIFGISQMFFGVMLSVMNHRYFNDTVNIICEFLPEMLFLMCIFGYLIVLIFYKWIAYDSTMAGCAPSLLINLINMFLLKNSDDRCDKLYEAQTSFQSFLLLVVVICVPWLLVPKPFLLKRAHRIKMESQTTDRTQLVSPSADCEMTVHSVDGGLKDEEDSEMLRIKANSSAARLGQGHGSHDDGTFSMGDVFVHQCIHTIEYCLGCISHTASYLRLWALSLAHAELSEVLWNMILHIGFNCNGYVGVIAIYVLFTPWACLTVFVLLCMEGLSAFLHTLRLHWVEFQSKFYKGEGYLFEPFSFKHILSVTDDE